MNDLRSKLAPSWRSRVGDALEGSSLQALFAFLESERALGRVIHPEASKIFAAFEHTPFDAVRVVILGQDPYHGPGQAHGLAFSVRAGVAPPPSLVNVFKEIERDLGVSKPDHGCLTPWADRGVLLLNSALTVEEGKAGSHQKRGWEGFTDAVIRAVSRERSHVVFLLWGSHAQKKRALVDTSKHLVLEVVHPSPLSAHRGFFGCGHFSKANAYLTTHGLEPIDWSLPRQSDGPDDAGT